MASYHSIYKIANGSLSGVMAKSYKCLCDLNPSYFQFVKNHAT